MIRHNKLLIALFVGCLALQASSARGADDLGLTAPAGFEVSLYADDSLAHNIYSLTIDAHGRVVVAGPDYVKILHDSDDNGTADSATLFSEAPHSGAHGMCFDGSNLLCTGDEGVWRFRDADGDLHADGPGERWATLGNSEHGANGLVRGPDGWFYLICGNDAGINDMHATRAGSPVKRPRCGGVMRFSPDGAQTDVYAHGFRNPYDLDFTADGRLLTVDSDGERDHYLPWYAPMRLFDVAQGREHGWLLNGWQRSWNRPEWFYDNVEHLAEMGRGSPTGLVVYRHRQFPARYGNGVFTACWTLGRIYFVPLVRQGASDHSPTGPEIFLQTTGDVGFAPVDMAVGPEGDLYVAVGGRGTQGSVFRVRYPAGFPAPPVKGNPLEQVLAADQPLASWSHARWAPLAQGIGRKAFAEVLSDPKDQPQRQVRAIEILTELFDGPTDAEARAAMRATSPEVRARIAWALARRSATPAAARQLAQLTRDAHPLVQRAAWEALSALQPNPQSKLSQLNLNRLSPTPNWQAAALSKNHRVRSAMLRAARQLAPGDVETAFGPKRESDPPRKTLARLWLEVPDGETSTPLPPEFLLASLDLLDRADDDSIRLEAARLIQLGLGDLHVQPDQPEVYSGYSGNATDKVDPALRRDIGARLAAHFPSSDPALDSELARLFAMLQTEHDGLLARLADKWTPDSLPQNDIHYLIVVSRLPGERSLEFTARTAVALVGLHPKMAARRMYPDRNWPLRVGELFDELCRRDPALSDSVAQAEGFGFADHSLFAARMNGDAKQTAARRLLERAIAADDSQAWTAELVRVLSSLPDDEILPHLRDRWDDFGLRDAIALVLADRRQAADRSRLVEALSSLQGEVVIAVAGALATMPAEHEPNEALAAVRALRQYGSVPEQQTVRQALDSLLAHWSGQRGSGQRVDTAPPAPADPDTPYAFWSAWLSREYPDTAAQLGGLQGADADAWKTRLAAVAWSTGDIERGKAVFDKRSCQRCHVGGGRLGPALKGAAARFSRDDLFAAIIDPSHDVSPLHQTTLVVTRSGAVYHGVSVYDSADGLLLQTAADTTVRITGDELLAMHPSQQSLMPTGLLNDATDQDLADLYAYLKMLSE